MLKVARPSLLAVLVAAQFLSACDRIPGTEAHKIATAKELVSRDLIDPTSPIFRDLSVKDDTVCGEVNAKNRMGAYTGFVRFYAYTSIESANIDPQFRIYDLFSAQRQCSSIRSSRYGSLAARLSACERAAEQEMRQSLQEMFNDDWNAYCEGQALPKETGVNEMNEIDPNLVMDDIE